MLNDIQAFVNIAMRLGLGVRLAELVEQVQASIDTFPDIPDRRYLVRLEMQRERLANPDLRLVGALLVELCADDPQRLEPLQPVLARLLPHHPYLTPLCLPSSRSVTSSIVDATTSQ